MQTRSGKAVKSRKTIVAEAERLFRLKGFDSTPVAEVMKAAGMTHGGFYNHFASKSDLEAAAVKLGCDLAVDRIETLVQDEARSPRFDSFLQRYLSSDARDAEAPFCPLLAYGAYIERSGKETQVAFAGGLDSYLDHFATNLSGKSEVGPSEREAAIRAFSAMVGAMYLARAVRITDRELSDEILEAARSAALES